MGTTSDRCVFHSCGRRAGRAGDELDQRVQDTRAKESNAGRGLFSSGHSYISASWYGDPKQAGTWNYQAVHVKGVLKFLEEADLHLLLTKLTETFENNPHSPSLVRRMDENYVQSMMKAIIAFEIEVTSIDHVFKLSQNRNENSYENIIEQLQKGNEDARSIAAIMKERQRKVFPE